MLSGRQENNNETHATIRYHIVETEHHKERMKKEILPIRAERILLRKIVESDIENIYNGLSNPLVIKHYGISFDSLEATKEQMKWFEDPVQFWWAICSLDNQVFYGAGGMNDLSNDHKKSRNWTLVTS